MISIRRSAVLLLVLFSMLAVPSAFAAGRPGGGTPIDPYENCTEWPTKKTVIVLDPGHGGGDGGTSYDLNTSRTRDDGDVIEKDVVLDIAILARGTLIGPDYGYTVCLTRIIDTALGNSERGDFANSVNAKLFVMIHLNGSSDSSVNYTSTFWGKKRKDLAFSDYMFKSLSTDLMAPDPGFVGQLANGALLSATMESTLTESVFLTNEKEGPLLDVEGPKNEDGINVRRKQIADAIAGGIHSYLNLSPQP